MTINLNFLKYEKGIIDFSDAHVHQFWRKRRSL